MQLADEEFVRQIPNGQDMVAEFFNPSHVGPDIDVILTIKVQHILSSLFSESCGLLSHNTGWSRKSRLANYAIEEASSIPGTMIEANSQVMFNLFERTKLQS
ncbi:hypothetical protein BJX65DRAFT_290912 [Aspergillus insuetus]